MRPTFDRTPLVKITKPKLLDLRTSLKEREEPIGNATINTLFASLSAAYIAERAFLWLQCAARDEARER